MGFRKRMRIDIRKVMQIDSLDKKTKNILYNIAVPYISVAYGRYTLKDDSGTLTNSMSLKIAILLSEKLQKNHVFKTDRLQEIFDKYDYSYVYDFLEIAYEEIESFSIKKEYFQKINCVLENEKCNYRMGEDGLFLKIVNEEEFQSINQTLNTAIDSVKIHFQKAVSAYSTRLDNINYTEVCNESIKAVEALTRKYLKDAKYQNKTLGSCLEPLRQKYTIPSFIIEPITKIWNISNYGDTATRHAIQEGKDSIIHEPEAYYIMITCSSFINYMYKMSY